MISLCKEGVGEYSGKVRMKQMNVKLLLIVGCQLVYSVHELTLIIIGTVKWYCKNMQNG